MSVNGGMSRLFNRLELDKHLALDDQVDAKAFFECQPVILKANHRLSLHMKSALLERSRQHGFIDGLQQSWPEMPVNLDRLVDDRVGDIIEFSHCQFW